MNNSDLLDISQTSASDKNDLQDGAEPGLQPIATDGQDIKLESLLPFLQHAPGLNLQDDHGTYIICGGISSSVREALIEFASRVSQLKLSTTVEDGKKISSGIFIKLAKLSDLLFPCLDRLSVKAEDTIFDALEIFLTPSLRHFEISDVDERLELSFGPSIATLRDVAHWLDALSFKHCKVYEDVLISVSSFQHLTRLTFNDSSLGTVQSFVEHVGKMKSLTFLCVFASADQLTCKKQPIQTRTTSHFFTRLEDLYLVNGIDVLENFLAYVSTPTLRTLALSFHEGTSSTSSTSTIFERTLEAALSRWINTLVSIIIRFPDSTTLTGRLFTRILRSPALCNLDIGKGVCITSLDRSLRCLHRMECPRLQNLLLPIGSPDCDAIQLSTLEIVLDACPNLKILRCRLGMRRMNAIPLSRKSLNFHAIEALHLDNHEDFSDNTSLPQIARFIDGVCPLLKQMVMVDPNGKVDQIHASWRSIHNMIGMFREVRAEERQRVKTELLKNGGGEIISNETFVTLSVA